MRINPEVNHENYAPQVCRYDVNFIWNIEIPSFKKREEKMELKDGVFKQAIESEVSSAEQLMVEIYFDLFRKENIELEKVKNLKGKLFSIIALIEKEQIKRDREEI